MNIKKLTLNSPQFPESVRRIANPPPQLFCAGAPLDDLMRLPRVAIVGSRNVTPYGKQVTMKLAGQLAERGIVIVSGLAIGVDALAHRATLDAGGLALAVLPSPVERIAPHSNQRLGQAILDSGGTLVSEYAEGMEPMKHYFIARNRIVAGLADVLLITEAAEKSGSLHTARYALEQGKEVLAVPGNITSSWSVGTNNLIRAGATPVTTYLDVLHALKLEDKQIAALEVRGRNDHEQTVLNLLQQGISDGDRLLDKSRLSTSQFNQVLTMLEIGGKIRSLGANHWGLH